jgi:ATP-dependent helicase HrpB
VVDALLKGIREIGHDALPWDTAMRGWQARVMLMRSLDPLNWPDVSDETLLETLEEWLAPYVEGVRSFDALQKIDLGSALHAIIGPKRDRELGALAPTHYRVPSGALVRIEYPPGLRPVLPVQIQKMFGATQTPTIAGGRVKLLLHLLSPARRPVQVTEDLVSFWRNAYPVVRKELRGRYPKHPWPEDPTTAPPTNSTRRRSQPD